MCPPNEKKKALQQESDRRENSASVVINMIGKQLVNEIKTDKCWTLYKEIKNKQHLCASAPRVKC